MDTPDAEPRDLSEAFAQGYIDRDELVRVYVGGLPYTFRAERLSNPSRIHDDVIKAVVRRKTRPYPQCKEAPYVAYDRNRKLFQHIDNYLHDPNRWKCPDANIKSRLIDEATYFKLDGMIGKLMSVDAQVGKLKSVSEAQVAKETNAKSPYFRVEVERSGVIDVPMTFGEDLHQVAQRCNMDVIIIPSAQRVIFKLNRAQDVMDEFVVELIGRGYNLFAVNDLETRSIYHFRN